MLQRKNIISTFAVTKKICSMQPDIKKKPRQGWAEAIQALSEEELNEKLLPDFFENEDLSWWQWENDEKEQSSCK